VKFIFDSESFGKALRTKRLIDLNWDIRSAAKKIGVSAATLSRCENGKTPDLINFFKLCQWVNRPVHEFVFKHKKQKK
jgi:transcriptional regulator with XRE-family HTH domain